MRALIYCVTCDNLILCSILGVALKCTLFRHLQSPDIAYTFRAIENYKRTGGRSQKARSLGVDPSPGKQWGEWKTSEKIHQMMLTKFTMC